MKFNFLLIFLLLTGCSNLKLTGEAETMYSSGIQRSVNKTKIQYKTEYGDVPVTFTSAIIHDMKNLNKPINVASSVEIWFW